MASEVRVLAQRSAGAANEIKGLIVASVDRVDAGGALIDEAGRTMLDVVKAIERVTAVTAEIRAAGTEQSAAAAESLKVKGQELVEATAFFRVE